MPRDHVEFVQSQHLPWESVEALPRPGTEIKVLSRDASTGAMSCLLRYPSGWSMSASQRLAADEEFYVLQGELAISERTYGEGDYAFLPAGYPRAGLCTSSGAVVLTFFESLPREITGEPNTFDTLRLVEYVSSQNSRWGGASDKVIANDRVRRLVLKPDEIDGDRTWILKIDASEDQPFEVDGIERHPCVEEMFLLDGDFVMACGRMTPGAYFWRPPMIAHGPMGTRHGFTGFFRAKEGSFSTLWDEPDGPIEWAAPYRPILPEDVRLRVAAQRPADASRW